MLEEFDVPYARVGEHELLLRVYRDPDTATGHGIVSVHGGAWCRNDRTSAHVLDRGLARAGLTVFALDFRQGPAFKFPAATQDITAGIRFARSNSARFNIAPDTLGIIGSSSGGQSVLLCTLTCGAAMHEGTPVLDDNGAVDGQAVSAAVAYSMALWPVSNPQYRYHYARDVGREDLLEGHRAYFSSEAQMHEASIPRILDDGEHTTPTPPLWIVQAGADDNVPQAMTQDLLRALQQRDCRFDYVFYPREPHALTRDDTPAAARCIADARAFIFRCIGV